MVMQNTLSLWDIEEVRDEILGDFHSVPTIIVAFLSVFSGFAFLQYSQIIGTLIITISFIPTILVFKQQIEIR